MNRTFTLPARLLLWVAFFFGLATSVRAQDFFTENFNSGTTIPTGWVLTNAGAPEATFQVKPTTFVYNGTAMPFAGSNFMVTLGDAGGSGSVANSILVTPTFNTASASLLFFEFDQHYRDYSAVTTDSAIVDVWDGVRWVKIQSLGNGNDIGTVTAPARTKINITQWKNAGMKLRFRTMGDWPWWWLFDNVRVYSPVPNDIGVSFISSPVGDCGLSASSQVKVTVANFGSASQTSIPVSYKINDGTVVTQTFTGNLAPATTAEFTFTQTVNLNAPGTYVVKAWTGLSGDNIISNDSASSVAVKGNASFGIQSFTGYNGANLSDITPGWKEQAGATPAGTASAWRSPATVQQTTFGTTTACINLYTNNRNEWIVTPTLVPGANSGLVFRAAVTNWLTSEPDAMGSDDKVQVMVSTNCGQTWSPIKTFDKNSGLINKLVTFSLPLSTFAGQEIRLGFFATDGPTDDPEDYDFHLDSIRIKDLPPVDMAVGSILGPISGCGVANAQVSVSLTNNGTQPITNFPVCYTANGAAAVCQNFPGTLDPGASTVFNFNASAALSQPGDYFINVYTNASGDGDRASDTIRGYFFQNLPTINTFPYFQSFETGNGGWIPGGTFSSWELGTPAKTIIQGAAQGTKAFVTGGTGTGTYNSNEKSFVVSPCINFSGLQNPVFEMKAWWASEYSEDGAVLQSSIDGGASWQTVGTLGDVSNWYNDNSADGLAGTVVGPRVAWTGGLNDNFGSNGWVTVRNELKSLGGQANVKLRIAFGSGANIAGDGFAFDAIRISEKPDRDIAFASIERPQLVGCGLTDTTHVRIKVKNVGKLALTNFTLGYRVVGRPIVLQNITGNLDPDQTLTYRFPVSENLSQVGTYSIQSWAITAGDGFTGNDSLKLVQVTKRGAMTDTIRFTGFTNNNLGFLYPNWGVGNGSPLPVGSTSQWRASQPSQTAYYGQTMGRLNMFSNTRQDWVLSPAYKIQPNAFLNFDMAVTETLDSIPDASGGMAGTDDRLRVMVSTSCGDSWTEVFAVTSADNVTRVRKRFKAPLSAYAGQEIRFAFFGTTGPVNNNKDYDIMLNNIFIETLESTDAGVAAVVSPRVSCGLTASVPVVVTVKNFGAQAISSVPVYYQINDLPPVQETYVPSLAPQASANYTFTQTANLSLSQPYTIKAWTGLSGDVVTTNNESVSTLTKLNAPIPVQPLAGYNGSNLGAVWPGWTEGKGTTVTPQESAWTSGLAGGTNTFKIALTNQQKVDWILSPGVKLSTNNFLIFKAAQFSSGGTGSAVWGPDDSVSVLISTNCGQTWRKIFKIGPGMQPAITNSLQSYSISLAAYNNQEVRFGFRARDGVRVENTSDVYIGDLTIASTLTQDLGPVSFSAEPPIVSNSFLKDSSYTFRVTVKNFGTEPVAGLSAAIRFADNTVLSQTQPGPLAPGQSAVLDLGSRAFNTLAANQVAKIYTSLSGDQALTNDTVNFTYAVVNPVSVREWVQPGDFALYPNPARGLVTLATPLPGMEIEAQVFDLTGREMGRQKLVAGPGGEAVLSLEGLAPGVYSVAILKPLFRFRKMLRVE